MTWDISRRVFLRGAGLAAVGVGIGPASWLVRAAEAASGGNSVFVHVFLRGGADGLSMAVPYGDPLYYEWRGPIALPKPGQDGGVVRLDDYFGLHPALAPLAPLYKDGRLGFIHGVGNYDVSRSHFSAQDFVETGTPGVRTTTTGMLARAAKQVPGGNVIKSVAFASRRPPSFLGPDPVLVALNLGSFDVQAPEWRADAERYLKSLYDGTGLGTVGTAIFQAVETLQKTPEIKAKPSNGADYPEGQLGKSMRQAAQIIKAGVGTRCIFVDGAGSFDTHSRQLEANVNDFTAVGGALAAFDRDLGQKMDDVVVLVTTEFGRTVFLNGSQGTDHGSGYCAIVMGGRVKGGRVHGRWPGLAKAQLYEERDLAVTTDFRELFSEVAQKHLGVAAPAGLFPGFTLGTQVGFLA